jgi:hypothetical protein
VLEGISELGEDLVNIKHTQTGFIDAMPAVLPIRITYNLLVREVLYRSSIWLAGEDQG